MQEIKMNIENILGKKEDVLAALKALGIKEGIIYDITVKRKWGKALIEIRPEGA